MSWRISVRHCTGYKYATAARSSYNEARMTPISSDGQHTLESRLEVTPRARPLRYVDYWGTVVDAFDVHVPHTELVVTATSVVETTSAPAVPATPIDWTTVELPRVRDRFVELLAPSRFVIAEPDLTAIGQDIARSHPPLAAGRLAASWTREQISYERGLTGVHTTSAQAREAGKGVCQDYAHITLALLRAIGLPARYVSGYLFAKKDAEVGVTTRGESHAWVEFWAGEWTAVDPTTLITVAERHVVVARGRDYADVRPLSGVYNGPPAESLGVTVELTRLR